MSKKPIQECLLGGYAKIYVQKTVGVSGSYVLDKNNYVELRKTSKRRPKDTSSERGSSTVIETVELVASRDRKSWSPLFTFTSSVTASAEEIIAPLSNKVFSSKATMNAIAVNRETFSSIYIVPLVPTSTALDKGGPPDSSNLVISTDKRDIERWMSMISTMLNQLQGTPMFSVVMKEVHPFHHELQMGDPAVCWVKGRTGQGAQLILARPSAPNRVQYFSSTLTCLTHIDVQLRTGLIALEFCQTCACTDIRAFLMQVTGSVEEQTYELSVVLERLLEDLDGDIIRRGRSEERFRLSPAHGETCFQGKTIFFASENSPVYMNQQQREQKKGPSQVFAPTTGQSPSIHRRPNRDSLSSPPPDGPLTDRPFSLERPGPVSVSPYQVSQFNTNIPKTPQEPEYEVVDYQPTSSRLEGNASPLHGGSTSPRKPKEDVSPVSSPTNESLVKSLSGNEAFPWSTPKEGEYEDVVVTSSHKTVTRSSVPSPFGEYYSMPAQDDHRSTHEYFVSPRKENDAEVHDFPSFRLSPQHACLPKDDREKRDGPASRLVRTGSLPGKMYQLPDNEYDTPEGNENVKKMSRKRPVSFTPDLKRKTVPLSQGERRHRSAQSFRLPKPFAQSSLSWRPPKSLSTSEKPTKDDLLTKLGQYRYAIVTDKFFKTFYTSIVDIFAGAATHLAIKLDMEKDWEEIKERGDEESLRPLSLLRAWKVKGGNQATFGRLVEVLCEFSQLFPLANQVVEFCQKEQLDQGTDTENVGYVKTVKKPDPTLASHV